MGCCGASRVFPADRRWCSTGSSARPSLRVSQGTSPNWSLGRRRPPKRLTPQPLKPANPRGSPNPSPPHPRRPPLGQALGRPKPRQRFRPARRRWRASIAKPWNGPARPMRASRPSKKPLASRPRPVPPNQPPRSRYHLSRTRPLSQLPPLQPLQQLGRLRLPRPASPGRRIIRHPSPSPWCQTSWSHRRNALPNPRQALFPRGPSQRSPRQARASRSWGPWIRCRPRSPSPPRL